MKKENLYGKKLAKYTDFSYSKKDYLKETKFILQVAKQLKVKGKTIIDVSCGSGNHSKVFSDLGYLVHGVDLNGDMLALARKTLGSKAKLYKQDMRKLDIPVKADILVCLFNSINYNLSYKELKTTLTKFYNHLKPDGIVVFDTFVTKTNWINGHLSNQAYKVGDADVVRISKSTSKDDIAIVYITYVIHKGNQKSIIETNNVIMLLEPKKVLEIMEQIGFKTKLYYNFSLKKASGGTNVFVGKK
jgi:ubiquinone/menaquinone biosynthesis C-methylase UbiE